MKQTRSARLPRMRQKGLIIDKLPDEVLVYDTERHKAHCLNHSAALVWEQCDGRTEPRDIARRVQAGGSETFTEEMVWLAVRQLNKSHLLDESFDLPPHLAGLSRREMVRVLGIAAVVAVPVITSIVAPTAVQASTCVGNGGSCTSSAQCCAGLVCCTATNHKCRSPAQC